MVRRVLMEHGLREIFVMGATYSHTRSGVVDLPVATRVDDLMWASEPENPDLRDSGRGGF